MGESNGVFQGKVGEPTVGMVRGRGEGRREGRKRGGEGEKGARIISAYFCLFIRLECHFMMSLCHGQLTESTARLGLARELVKVSV